eukprot:302851_1
MAFHDVQTKNEKNLPIADEGNSANDGNDANQVNVFEEGKVAQYDENYQNAKHSKMSKLLTEWHLSEYTDIMNDEGWDDPDLWHCIDDHTLQNVLHFKSGHMAKFKANLRKFQKSQEEKRQKFTVKLILLGDCQVGKSSLVMRLLKTNLTNINFQPLEQHF